MSTRNHRGRSRADATIGRPRRIRAIKENARLPLAVVVEERLRDGIMFGTFALGESISEDRLATQLGVSRTPVREALAALQLQGMVSIRAQRGSYVFQPSESDITELCEYRLLIERDAILLAHRRAHDETLKAMRENADAVEAAEEKGDTEGAARSDAKFHYSYIKRCGNKMLIQAYDLAAGRIGAIRFIARASSDAWIHASPQHREIIDAFAAGDMTRMEQVLIPHVMNMQDMFREALRHRDS